MEFLFCHFTRLFALQSEDVQMILDSSFATPMDGKADKVALARKIKAEHLAISFLVLKRWETRGHIERHTGMSAKHAKRTLIALSEAITNSEWWLDNEETVNLPRVLKGKVKIDFEPGVDTEDANLSRFFLGKE
jgi:hypothetical protein